MSAPWNCTPGQLKVPELKEELRKRGITPKGLKKDLVEKLEEVLRIEGQGHFGNMLSCSSPPPVHISYNSPLLAADSRGLHYDSPPQAADPRGPCYNSPPPITDSKSLHHNSPLQLTDPKSPSHNLPHRVSDPSHNSLQVSGRKNAEVEVHDLEWKSAVANAQSSSISAKIEDNCQKLGDRQQLSLGAKNPFGVAHGFESSYYDSKKGAAHPNDPAMELCDEREFVSIDTTNRVHWSRVDGNEPEASRFAVGDPESGDRHDKADTSLGKAVDRDKKSILSAIDANLLEKHGSLIISDMEDPMEFKGMHNPYSRLNPPSRGFESESSVNLEQSEAHVTWNSEEGDHSRGRSEQESEEQEDKGSDLPFWSGGVFKLSDTSQHLAENTCSKIISVCEKHLECGDDQNRYVSLNPSLHEIESETRPNPEQSEAICLKQNMVECESAVGTGQQKRIEHEIDRDGVYEVSGSDLNFAMEQKFRMKSVSERPVELEDMHKQYTSLNPTSYEFESESRVNSEELEAAHLKQNREDCNAPMGANKWEFEEPEDKGNALLFHSDKSDKLSEMNTNLVEKQHGKLMSPGADPKEPVPNKYINSNLTSHELESEHRPNTEELEAAQLNQHREEYYYPMGTNDPKFEEHEDKGSASSKSNLILDERQKFQEMALSKEQTEAHDAQNQHLSLNSMSHEYESKPGESEVVDHKQNREEYNHPMGTGAQEFEECKGKGDDLRFRSDDVPRLCEINPNVAVKSNRKKEPGDPDNVLNQYIILNSISHGFESESRVNSEESEAGKLEMNRRKYDHPMAMGKQEEQEEGNASMCEEVSCPQGSLTDGGREISQFPKPQSGIGSLSECLAKSRSVKMSKNREAGEVRPTDVDSEAQVGKKRTDKGHDTDGEPRQQEPAKRQRRWNSGRNFVLDASNTAPLTTNILKESIPQKVAEVSFGASSLSPIVSSPASSTRQSLSKAEKTSFSRPAPPPLKSDSGASGENCQSRLVPPPLRSASTSLKVERLLRPFTLKALKELLSETGTIRYFWIDQIKTHCYVTYSSVEEATATRNALYNLKWPIIGGHLLVAEFADPEEVKLHCEGKPANVTNASNPLSCAANITQGSSALTPQGPSGHISAYAVPSSPPAASRNKRTLPSQKGTDPEPEPAIYTLDDLFKKTQAKPHIYYLPLTEEEVAAKLAARKQIQTNKLSVKHEYDSYCM